MVCICSLVLSSKFPRFQQHYISSFGKNVFVLCLVCLHRYTFTGCCFRTFEIKLSLLIKSVKLIVDRNSIPCMLFSRTFFIFIVQCSLCVLKVKSDVTLNSKIILWSAFIARSWHLRGQKRPKKIRVPGIPRFCQFSWRDRQAVAPARTKLGTI